MEILKKNQQVKCTMFTLKKGFRIRNIKLVTRTCDVSALQ